VSNPVTGREAGQAICEVLGLDPAVTGRIVIVLDPLEVATVSVNRLLTLDEVRELGAVLDRYRLVSDE
jgi:hydrogenase maturation factor